MSVLRSLETKIAGLVEGAFSRAFKSEVRPVELARKLAREMEQHRTVSISRVYVPNEYGIYLSPQDRARFEGYEDELVTELSAYLLEHARRERLALVSRPVITFHTDANLKLGEFGIQARTVRAAEVPGRAPEQGDHGQTVVYRAAPAADAAVRAPASGRRRTGLLVVDGRRMALGAAGGVIGRSRECDVVLADANVSRRHAEVRPTDGGWEVLDLGSTNGVRVNGRRIRGRAPLRPGDHVVLGASDMVFEEE